ncbi:MAG: NADH-quinone oxidoreductase subunit L [Deltaproteobacteria bacterium]
MTQLASYFKIDALSGFIGAFVGFFSLLAVIYSFGFMKGRPGLGRYYLYVFLTAAASLAAVFANNLVVFLVFWGFLGMLLYLLIDFGKKERAPATAKKAFIIIGGTDAFMILGVAILWSLSGTLDMDKISVTLDGRWAVAAYLCLAGGAFAKAGAMPFHTWVPDTAEDAPVPVAAFLPASLDKLLGIYFLTRLSLDVFRMNPAMNTVLMAAGSITIVAGVMMALVQHDLKRLLGYHAVSQVGYMVLGIGTGNPIGIAGGLFHMLNNAVYKSCLFFAGGSVEKQAGTTDLDRLGGLSRAMPATFLVFLIASFAISGVPPLNGFASKWMVYQGVLETARAGGGLWVLWLLAAMVGSALTLASFMKLLHAVFMGQPYKGGPSDQPSQEQKARLAPPAKAAGRGEPVLRDAPAFLLVPGIVLALLCVVFGVWAYRVPLKMLILPSLGGDVVFSGVWSSGVATLGLVLALLAGALIYFLGNAMKTRSTPIFVGGESAEGHPEMRVSGTAFYNTIQEIGFLKTIYGWAAKKFFDVYEIGSRLTFGFNRVLRYIHNGVLPTYLSWCLLGMLVLFYVFFRS